MAKKKQNAKAVKAWLQTHAAGEKKFARAMRKYFREQAARVMAAAKEHDTLHPSLVAQLFDADDEYSKLHDAVDPVVGELLATGAARVFAMRPAKLKKARTITKAIAVDWDDFDLPAGVVDAVSAQFDQLVEQPYWADIIRGSERLITDALQDAIEAGESIPKMRKRLQESFSVMNRARAERIARTETTGALNLGHQTGFDNLIADGDISGKTWLAIIDDDTRETHAAADGQTVGVGESFRLGTESAIYPGHPGLSAKERINCRCTIAADWNE